MKTIILKKLQIVNFKGIRSLSINFQGKNIVISGRNESGKTTIRDAFLWCLFGKNSAGETNFSIKTWGDDKNPILHVDHEVKVTLSVDDQEISLKRCYREKWGTGKNSDSLMGHFVDYYKNDVKLETKKTFDAEVSSIIPEDVFRMITGPTFFPGLPEDKQKALLLDLAGDVEDKDIAKLKPEYLELLSQLKGTPLSSFRKEILAKKRAINDELKGIPDRIDEVHRSIPDVEDWKGLSLELKEKQKKVSVIEGQIADKSNKLSAEYERKAKIQKQIGDKKIQRLEIENTIREKANAKNSESRSLIQKLNREIEKQEEVLYRLKNDITSTDAEIKATSHALDLLRAEYRKENAKTLTFPEGAFICPTCKRPLEAEDIEWKQTDMTSNFNLNKSKKLKDNQIKGKKTKEELVSLNSKKDSLLIEEEKVKKEIEKLQAEQKEQQDNLPKEVNTDSLISTSKEWISLGNEITELKNQLITGAPKDDNDDDLKSGKSVLIDAIDDLKARLSKKDRIDQSKKRINELEDQKVAANQKLADLEKQEFTITEFQKAKDEELKNRINNLFKIVSFSFTSEQLTGNEKIKCILWVKGVPYSDVNSGTKVNAGLDIINAISKAKGICAPIFVDNRESINDLIPTLSQVINLKVDENKLRIKNEDGIINVLNKNI